MTREEILEIAKPILFNTDMVKAILDDRKSVTRRVIKPQPSYHEFIDVGPYWQWFDAIWVNGTTYYLPDQESKAYSKMRYKPGDYLYVRETWCPYDKDHIINGEKYAYKANESAESERVRKEYGYKWHSSIHMPKEAARIFLRVTDVKVHLLQTMTLDDFLAEGVILRPEAFNDPENAYQQAKKKFIGIWDTTTDELMYKWNENPWVVAYGFESIEV